jgi:hypothetical protein
MESGPSTAALRPKSAVLLQTLAACAMLIAGETRVCAQNTQPSRSAANRAPAKTAASGVTFLNSAPGVRYVGSQACKLCHFAIFDKFSRTDMAQSTAPPQALIDRHWLTEPIDIFNSKYNRHYLVFQRGSKVYQSEYELDPQGNEVFRHTEELAYVVGTGENGATPVVRRGNFLFQAPLSYYSARKAWDLSPNYEIKDLGFTLPVTADCIGCHAGRTQPVMGHEGLYEDPPLVEMGIACERCHGPGELHVHDRKEGVKVSGKIDRTIVNPAKLSNWMADNICMNCHEGDIRSLQAGKTEGDFRPGTPLNDTMVILKSPIDPKAEQTPLLEHYYSMTLSACYRNSSGKMGCQTCHDPHVQPADDEAATYFRGKCLKCHGEKACTGDMQARMRQTPRDSCTTCHMTRQPALTVSHSTLTDHRITRTTDEPYPKVALRPTLAGTGFIHVNAVPGRKDMVAGPALLHAYRQELIRGHLEFKDYYFSLLEKLRKAGSRDPFVLSALAQKASSDGDSATAIAYAKEVIDRGSTSTFDYLLLDGLLANSWNPAASIALLMRGLEIAPYNNFFYENLATREFQAGDAASAMETLRRGLELNPEDSTLRAMQQQAAASGLNP